MSAAHPLMSETAINKLRIIGAYVAKLHAALQEFEPSQSPLDGLCLDPLELGNPQLDALQPLKSRLDALELGISRLQHLATPVEKPPAAENWICLDPDQLSSAQAHNTLARLHNSAVLHGADPLIPLHNNRNQSILGFPPTLGHLLQLNHTTEEVLRNAFGLDSNKSLSAFCGVGAHHRLDDYILPENVALSRILRRFAREAEIQVAGEPTPATTSAAEKHNSIARKHNGRLYIKTDEVIPIHDERNIPVTGFPGHCGELENPNHLADVLYFLKEYKQSVEVEGCIARWFIFCGLCFEYGQEDDCEYHSGREWLL